jgi:hypothetical protein
MDKQKVSHDAKSRNVRVSPEFREEPDIEKLARAFISIAKGLAEKKAAEERGLDNSTKNF